MTETIRMVSVRILLPFSILAFLLACKPSVESEMKKWAIGKQNATKNMSKWPLFKTHIEKTLAAAQTDWDAALKIKDEEKKAEAMSKANDKLNNKVVKGLNSINYKFDGVRDEQRKLSNLKRKHFSKRGKIANELNASRLKWNDALNAMNDPKIPESMENAEGAVDKAKEKLDKAESSLRRTRKSISGKKKKFKYKKKKKKKK